MEIQYQRNLKNSYMVIIEPDRPLNPDGQLAERMLQRQQIHGLLTWVSMEHEKDMTFWYQITGMQSLTDRLQQNLMDHDLLQRLLATLLELQEELPRYYLKPEHLLLCAEQIFLDAGGGHIRFCYEPMWRQDPRESLQGLMEQLLPHIDHSDSVAVTFAYGLYDRCQQSNADIWQYVWDQVQTDAQAGRFAAETVEKSAGGPVGGSANKSFDNSAGIKEPPVEPVSQSMRSDPTEPSQNRGVYSSMPIQPQGRGIHIGLPGELTQRISEFTQRWQQMPEKYIPFRKIRKIAKKDKSGQQEAIYLFEPQEESVASEHPTVYLGAGTHAEGRLSYQGGGTQPSFEITGESFLIGGRHGQADGRIEASGVSRSHARITQAENAYYVEDLNSRNGTYLNGELLLYRQKRRLKPGDHLRFAQEEYIFY